MEKNVENAESFRAQGLGGALDSGLGTLGCLSETKNLLRFHMDVAEATENLQKV